MTVERNWEVAKHAKNLESPRYLGDTNICLMPSNLLHATITPQMHANREPIS